MLYFVRQNLIKAAHGHGMGRHTGEEMYSIMERDIQTLSDFLGDILFYSLSNQSWIKGEWMVSLKAFKMLTANINLQYKNFH